MAFSYVQSVSAGVGTAHPPYTLVLPNAQAGSLIVVTLGLYSTTPPISFTVTDSAGNTYTLGVTATKTGNDGALAVYYAVNAATGNLTITMSRSDGGYIAFAAAEYAGTMTGVPAGFSANGGSVNPSPGPVTVSGSNVLVVTSYTHSGVNLTSSTIAAPFTKRQVVLTGFSTQGIGLADDTAATGTVTPTWTLSNGDTWTAAALAFQPAVAPPPVASFSGTPTSGTAPVTVTFADTSSNSPTSWSWDFGDGGTSTSKNPAHTYSVPGVYNVTLTATNGSGSGTVTLTGYIVALSRPATPQPSQSGRAVSLVAVAQGDVYVTFPGGVLWTKATNATGKKLNTTGVVRSAANNQKLWFADGAHWLYYDPSQNAVLNWQSTAGVLPGSDLTPVDFPRLICTWRGRTVVSGIGFDPQNWFMSAVNDPTNWDDAPFPFVPTSAVVGNDSTLGLVGDVITALVPYSDDTLIFGGDHTIWMCVGDPAAGGQIDLISDAIGFAWGNAWAKDPYLTLYFVSNQTGIYTLMPGQGPPVRISQQIEQFLTNINTGTNIIRLQWDDKWQGLHVFVSDATSAQPTTHFFWEQRTGAWWTDVFANPNHNPLCCVTLDGNTAADRVALIGSWDGFVRTMTPAALTDDGTTIASAVVIGPLVTRDLDMILTKDFQGILSATSGVVNWQLLIGPTPEIALSSVPVASGTFGPGRNLSTLARWSAHAIYVRLTSTNAWALETIRCRLQTMGKVLRRGL